MEGDSVWVAQTWKAHGYDTLIQGVYDSREAAFEGLKAEPNMTVYVGPDACLLGRPRNEKPWWNARWARAEPEIVRHRAGARNDATADWPVRLEENEVWCDRENCTLGDCGNDDPESRAWICSRYGLTARALLAGIKAHAATRSAPEGSLTEGPPESSPASPTPEP